MSSRPVGFSFSLLCFLSLAAVRPSFAVPSVSATAGKSVSSASTTDLLAVASETDPQCLDVGEHSSDDLLTVDSCTTTPKPVAQVESESADPKGKTSVGLWALGALALIGGVVAAASGGGSGSDGDDDGGDLAKAVVINTTDEGGDLVDQIYLPKKFETEEYKATGGVWPFNRNRRSGLEIINASYRYSFGATGDGVLVSVFDTGIDINHPEFDGDGKIHEESKTYFFDSEGNQFDLDDPHGHGTFVAGLIAANKDDKRMHGVAFESDLLILQSPGLIRTEAKEDYDAIIDAGYTPAADVLSDAFNTSVEAGAIVMNHSWGVNVYVDHTYFDYDSCDYSSSDTFRSICSHESKPLDKDYLITDLNESYNGDILDALTNAAENEMITVWAAGNEQYKEIGILPGLPVYFTELKDTWLAVVATDQDNEIASFSNHCGIAKDFCISAPGVGIYSAWADGGYKTSQGTSQAAPFVSGAVALLKHQFPSMGGAKIVQLIKETATDLGEEG
ncbi:MAG: hypothetical protein ERJ67_04005, partial [Aphanocapsa feldmannii 277cV]